MYETRTVESDLITISPAALLFRNQSQEEVYESRIQRILSYLVFEIKFVHIRALLILVTYILLLKCITCFAVL